MTQLTESRNYFIKNVTLNFAKLDKPVSPFGTEQYEIQAQFEDPKLAEELKANHFNVKEKDGKFSVSLKRKALKADGTPNSKPVVVDGAVKPFSEDQIRNIGNGSKGNVKVFQYPYEVAGRKGVGSTLSAVQITEYIEYKGGNLGFDIEEDASETNGDTPF